jgi:hypothetical protein
VTSETRAVFQNNDQARSKITKFRIKIPHSGVSDVNITLRGTNLGCGENLYVTPLNAAEAEKWTGRWSSCRPVVYSTANDGQDVCSYSCLCKGDCDEIQVAKRPMTIHESSWTLYPICLTYQDRGIGYLMYGYLITGFANMLPTWVI